MTIVAGTGSRSLAIESEDVKSAALTALREQLKTLKPSIVLSGGAEGWDAALAQAAYLEGIPYKLILPNKTYLSYYWGKTSVTGHSRTDAANKMVARAFEVVYTCASVYDCDPHTGSGSLHANFVRNHFLLFAADLALVYKPESKGTAHGVKELKRHNVPGLVWRPDEGWTGLVH